MATTVEATTRGQKAAAPADAPWYRDRLRLAVAGAVGLVLVALVAWLVVSSQRRKEEFAARSLNQARAAAEAGNLPLASSELQKLIDSYKGTDAATEAVITLNQVRMVNGQSELAAVSLRDFLAGNPAAQYRAPAYGLLGAAMENAKRFPEAAEAFTNASKAADLEYLKARYLIDAGRSYAAAGKSAEAIAAYREVVQKFPKASSVTEAQVRLAELTDGKM
ncbi:MAG TPA: tetratricopeptide repeat protein [Gemmatimonadales bacterium]|nr:tetratricopeptide repeat protein [Gemmatimonadales bacterium]